ncbi:MAG: multifunctional oxoglutarate decarboxylase/oxoglutarate dehydrogenase thiamine pyrophosphate-binding subunit/dihydrolipoyllysine-residue succinyltransferase subunit [Planctomycetota bacterium]|nr:multifunctional oxoglutarate decarboxylase/oxoglutarate dehydrogenase thiamine pyrophosphate-binding subunit/dihydrolipoyllysine-residue succinyltransferase subunit [Planctomycetota bacterium]
MGIDFESEYGVNAGYVQALHETWLLDPSSVESSWARIFERADPEGAAKAAAAQESATKAATQESEDAVDEDADYERLTGVSRLIVGNMTASLELPTATSVRIVPVKLLDENRRLINEHMAVRALGKASYTHLIAYAMIRALAEESRLRGSFVERNDQPHRRISKVVNFGIAIDVPGPKGSGRMLVVPKIAAADQHSFSGFHAAYEDVVARGRDGKLTSDDYSDVTVTLTNPGGFGTTMSVPRLMKGQGMILAVGSIGVPAEVRGMSPSVRAANAIGPVMTITSTYDHRVIQGAESGLFLRRVEELLSGADNFYDDIFRDLRVPWSPARPADDKPASLDPLREKLDQRSLIWQLVNAYRSRGCRLADLDPLGYKPDPIPSLDPATYGFTVWDLDRSYSSGDLSEEPTITLRQILTKLRRAYCRRWTVEYMHIVNRNRKLWVRQRIEDPGQETTIDHSDRLRILSQLSRAENFERFLHATYVGNKRFSLEGGDTMIPALAALIDRAAEGGVQRVVIGMAHRGRLNVLANIMGKSLEQIFSEFEGVLLPLSQEGTGDVKYHLGQRGKYVTPDGFEVEVTLSANPSHLEAVDPVVCGMTRAYQDELEDVERSKVLAVLIHGDAAFAGQGVVAETLNISQLEGYTNGGTVHLVVNNQIGFTASPKDTRSTYYCTDVAKAVQAPILHANGDNPEAVVRSVQVAVDYQKEFGGDVVIDMVCYRRWGHNEGDEPAYTQPVLYSHIRDHPTVSENYKQLLLRRGALTEEESEAIFTEANAELSEALSAFRARREGEPKDEDLPLPEIVDLRLDDEADFAAGPSPETAVEVDDLVQLIDQLNSMPEGHVTHPNLLRQLRRRERMVRGELDLDWGCAEALAFASLVREGISLRLSGQDSGRGTFSHRHAVIRHQETEVDHIPLASLAAEHGGSFEVYDSALSEEAVLGFEYGYALARPGAFVIWEAQFGDFINGAQIQIDQFITSGEAKWRQKAGLTLLLPHGFDGQGPEHSSARPERLLSLCSAGNMTVCNVSTAGQYFHLLRRQGTIPAGEARPLIVFTPKSMLRDKRAASPVEELATGGFREVIVDGSATKASRVILCTGKLRHELLDARATQENPEDFLIVSIEQLYPLPVFALAELFEAAGHADWVWCQEEPRNMGAWSFVLQRFLDQDHPLRYVGRAESSSPATGSYRRHQAEQEHLLRQAFGPRT